jgi:hypothetical protein
MADIPKKDNLKGDAAEAFRVRLPGFVKEEAVGLGDAVKRVTYALGMDPCGGCERRAARLNRWVVFTK